MINQNAKEYISRSFVLLAFWFISYSTSFSQQFLQTQGQQIVTEDGNAFLLRGMGLGGWMLQEGYMLQTAEFANAQYQIKAKIEELIGVDSTQMFYDAWLDHHFTEEDMIALKEWGFNSIRLPMHYNLFTLPIEDEPVPGEHTWVDKGFVMTDQVIDWCRKYEMYLILDLHAAPGGQGYDQGISDYNPNKPSLWESEHNKAKTVALWRRLAERYKDEAWVAGYDLLNEPNWDMNQNQPLRDLYGRLTDTIRAIGDQHILFIEGNWFANDFTGLTPPWDDNMVYSPHKYWSFNDQASIQWVLDMRRDYNIPLYLGESGENSNVWFKDAIQLLEDNNIGWAWWPMKKIDAIAGPLSVTRTTNYNQLLEYWKGNAAKPSSEFTFQTLMEVTELLRIENCKFQKDVIDAMFRQQSESSSLPFTDNKVPGLVYATDYDLGSEGIAYQDTESATYHVSTSNYTAWNNGWVYRNDGVDIELCEDNINTNGFNIGWIEDDEWLKYTLDVEQDGVYDLYLRTASTNNQGRIFIEIEGAQATDVFSVNATGDFQNWRDLVIPNITLNRGLQEFIIHFPTGGFNLSSLDFRYSTSSTSQVFKINKAITLDNSHVEVQLNKSLDPSNILVREDFTLIIDGETYDIQGIESSAESERILLIESPTFLRAEQQLRLTYSGEDIIAKDATSLNSFENFFVENTLEAGHVIPGLIQAEDFSLAKGIELEDCFDIGQGQNLAFLDPGDFIEYQVNVEKSGPYDLSFRTASENTNGRLRWRFIDLAGNTILSDVNNFPITGGWQSWESTQNEVELIEGQYTFRLEILNAPFNINWIDFESLIIEEPPLLGVNVYPNPVSDVLKLKAEFNVPHQLDFVVYNTYGQIVNSSLLDYATSFDENITVDYLSQGIYFLHILLENGQEYNFRFIKQ